VFRKTHTPKSRLPEKECNMAKMLGVWINVNNPSRTTSQDLNLTVGGTILLTEAEVRSLGGGGLFPVNVRIMDDDSVSDDLVHSDVSFQINVRDTSPHCFHTGVIVPHGKLNDCEPWYEDWAEIYARVSARSGNVQTNSANSQNVNVRID
jgi:hypothetical protein